MSNIYNERFLEDLIDEASEMSTAALLAGLGKHGVKDTSKEALIKEFDNFAKNLIDGLSDREALEDLWCDFEYDERFMND